MKNSVIKMLSSASFFMVLLFAPVAQADNDSNPPLSSGAILQVIQQPSSVSVDFNTVNTLTFVIRNNSSTPVPLNPASVVLSNASTLANGSVTNSCNNLVPASGTCTLSYTFTSAATPSATTVNVTFNYSRRLIPLPTNTFTVNVSGVVASNTRAITFTNGCANTLWIGTTGGSVNSKQSPPNCIALDSCVTTCASNADCYAGTQCSNGQCFSVDPLPLNGDYSLAPGASKVLQIPVPSSNINFQGIIWSGAFGARTGCAFNNANIFVCQTGTCSNSSSSGQSCSPGVGMQPPNTLAEITMLQSGVDSYDISIINGINVPFSFGPTGVSASPANPYVCGIAGNSVPVSSPNGTLGACNWDFIANPPPSIDYNLVTTGGGNCTTAANCTSDPNGPVCGLTNPAITAAGSGSAQKTCGQRLGYWTTDQVCGLNPSLGAPFNCSDPMGLNAPFNAYTRTQLLQCAPTLPSCYKSAGLDNACCGCVNWQTIAGIIVPTAPIVEQCPSTSAGWTTNILPELEWMKKACPSAYSYPFDDKTVSFTCSSPASWNPAINGTGYTVTFCPPQPV